MSESCLFPIPSPFFFDGEVFSFSFFGGSPTSWVSSKGRLACSAPGNNEVEPGQREEAEGEQRRRAVELKRARPSESGDGESAVVDFASYDERAKAAVAARGRERQEEEQGWGGSAVQPQLGECRWWLMRLEEKTSVAPRRAAKALSVDSAAVLASPTL